MKHPRVIDALLSLAAVTLAATAALAEATQSVDAPPSLNAPDLGQGPYSLMHMRLQKTLLKINVADIDVRIVWDPPWDPDDMMSDWAKDQLGWRR